ncbi:band 4.1-like protein 2 isoform X1 [Syngnathus typhle]|uniref:band 4.1-like protein 2 isoform X1 n=1 Tax=Syngnathus typhle TaxID=161592 RepID=UPI002A6AD70D|nr:band 4.1-like protein 2 isoform X1 [Syngnathus typhle]
MTTEAGLETEVKDKAERPAGGEEKAKEKEGKGIARYLPAWLKKRTSPSRQSPENGGREVLPQVNGHAEEAEGKEPQLKEKVLQSQPAGESETAEGGCRAEEGATEEPEGRTSTFRSPLRLVRKSKMKLAVCHVTLPDGSDFACEVEKGAKGLFLFFKVCEHLNLLEKDYFGLTYADRHDQKCWLDPTKEIKRQIRSNNWQFAFNVKFYPPDPSLLTEDITRYLLCLQLRQDVASGRLPCSFVTRALLASYTLQAEYGDWDPERPRPLDCIGRLTFAPNQSKEMEEKILELYKALKGQTPAQADVHFLENAKKLSMYGVDLHHAKDSEGVDITLGVCANGLLVYKDRLRINRFAWPKILKISYKRNNFYIKIRPGETEQFESSVGFKLQSHRSAKRLWKVCVENHGFFRLNAPEAAAGATAARFLTLGSKFRYSGRTQTQTRLASALIDRPAPAFQRTLSQRISLSLDGAPRISVTEADRVAADNGQRPHSDLCSDSKSPLRARVDNIYVRHSNLMLEEHNKSQAEVLKHQASVSQLKRSFMEAPPPSPPPPPRNLWDKRVASSPQQPTAAPVTEAAASAADNSPGPEAAKTTEVEIEETVAVREISANAVEHAPEAQATEQKMKQRHEGGESASSQSDGEAEYCPEREERNKSAELSRPAEAEEDKNPAEEATATPGQAPNGPANGEVAEDERPAQVICCSQPPVVKTETVTISDTFAEHKSEIATKEVPIVHTETKTITYEAAQPDGSGDGEPGVLTTAQSVTSESLCTTTTTHITKTRKGGLSETRIEKRIVITGDRDIDHDEALAQAIKEAKEQHPDMSVTRVVVHKETELADEDD